MIKIKIINGWRGASPIVRATEYGEDGETIIRTYKIDNEDLFCFLEEKLNCESFNIEKRKGDKLETIKFCLQ